MDIAEKVLQAKADYDAVYEAGKASGGGIVIDPDKIIEKTATGTLIRVDDVSEIPHKCTVSADKETNATVCGKNLLAKADEKTTNGITLTMDTDGTIHLNGTATAKAWFYLQTAFTLPIADYILSAHDATTDKVNELGFHFVDNSFNVGNIATVAITGVKSYNKKVQQVLFSIANGTELNDATFRLQVETGTTFTDYEPCKNKSYTLTAGQTIEIDSLCPIMIVSSSNDATITLDYNKSWGMQTEYDRFWDVFQNYGNRKAYRHAFRGCTFNEQIFKPKYDITPGEADFMFAYNGATTGEPYIADIKGLLEQAGVILDTSQATNMDYFCYLSNKVTRLPSISYESSKKVNNAFYNCPALQSIDELILKEDGTNTFNSVFNACNSLTHMIVRGTIGNNGFNVQWCPLDHESLMSIINALMYVGHTYTKTSTVVEPVGFYPSGQNFAPDWPAYTTTGEKVLCGYDNNATMIYCCLVDGVYYAVTEAPNTATYTLTLNKTHKDPSNPNALTDEEIAIATDGKGWSITWS